MDSKYNFDVTTQYCEGCVSIILLITLYVMKKIFWTTVFWLIVFFGFAFYIKMFDADMALNVSTWLGATTVTTS